MQLRNNYNKNVFNGDIGRIIEIDSTDQTVTVLFDEEPIEYEFSELDELALAYVFCPSISTKAANAPV